MWAHFHTMFLHTRKAEHARGGAGKGSVLTLGSDYQKNFKMPKADKTDKSAEKAADDACLPDASKDEQDTKKIRVKRVGNYIIGKTIGEGSFSKVRLGTHVLTNERIALKIIEKSKITEAADIERITREIQILKLLNHPNVIKLYEIVDTPRHVYIVQEYMNNGELFDYIVAKGRLSEKEACRFLCQLLNGLHFLHSRRIVHRDLKPENLLLTAHNDIKIIDFGLSNIFHDTFMKTCCGSPAYAPPEMIQGKLYSGPSADLWSTGIILYAMLCGCLPFEGSTTQSLYIKILSGEYSTPSYLSQGAKDVLKALLTVNPDDRITIEELITYPWIQKNWALNNEGRNEPILTELPEISSDLNFGILLQMHRMNLDAVECIRGLFLGKHNASTATYTLLAEKAEATRKSNPKMSMAAIIGINGYEKADFDDLDVKKKICAEIGVEIDIESNILHAENNTKVAIGKLKLEISNDKAAKGTHRHRSADTKAGDSSTNESAQHKDSQEKVTMKINEKDVELKRETAELAATVPAIPVGQVSKPPGLNLGLNLPAGPIVTGGAVTTRNHKTEKLVETPTIKTSSEAPEMTVEYDDGGLRIYKEDITKENGVVTTIQYEDLVARLKQVFKELRIKADSEREGSFRCERMNVQFSIDIYRIGSAISPQLGIMMRRISGDGAIYKEIGQIVFKGLKLKG